jgi:hypothetical protein
MDWLRYAISLACTVVFQDTGELDHLVCGLRLAPVRDA